MVKVRTKGTGDLTGHPFFYEQLIPENIETGVGGSSRTVPKSRNPMESKTKERKADDLGRTCFR